ncbi:hypothetical protein DOTSEDRAFT_38025 [Dothistroma septosporum NZE10]|uniref:Secreted protein n=1 Tax=Dothistroma septosporum (strain NZE10 / CBS 128990) TaxID=675120 RepID=N1PFC4_DOTSN|nr:hypothetical protein DOTSEDRAFT_38025 [Dothistroma septosporum NZE10]
MLLLLGAPGFHLSCLLLKLLALLVIGVQWSECGGCCRDLVQEVEEGHSAFRDEQREMSAHWREQLSGASGWRKGKTWIRGRCQHVIVDQGPQLRLFGPPALLAAIDLRPIFL